MVDQFGARTRRRRGGGVVSKDKEKKAQRMNGQQTHFVELKAVPGFPRTYTVADRWAMAEKWFAEDPSLTVQDARKRLIRETGQAVDNRRMAEVRNRIRFKQNLRPIGREYGCGNSNARIADIPMTQEERDEFARDFPELTKQLPRVTKAQRAKMAARVTGPETPGTPEPSARLEPAPNPGHKAKVDLERDIQAVADMAAEIPGLRRLEIAFDDDGNPVVRYAATMLAESTIGR